MANTINTRPLEFILSDFRKAGLSEASIRFMHDVLTRIEKSLTNLGQIQSVAPVTGRTEGIGTTVTQLNSSGLLVDADKVAADGATFGRINMTALTTNNVDLSKAGVVSKTADNIAETSNLKWRTAAHSATQPTSLTIAGVDDGAGIAHIQTSAFTLKVPGQTDVSYGGFIIGALANSTKYYIYFDDANFTGNPSNLVVTTDPTVLFQNVGRLYVGSCTTPAGGAGPTTGNNGGTGGSRDIGAVLT